MQNKTNIKNLVLIGLFSAIIILQTYTPVLGYIKLFGLVDFTIIHITVILAACLLGPLFGSIIGGVWGVTSMIYAYSSAGILTPLFYNPLISVVPRILVGFIAGLLYHLLSQKLPGKLNGIIAAAVGTLTNTTLVLGGFYFFGHAFIVKALNLATNSPSDPVLTFIFSLIGTNTIAEIIAAAVIVPALLLPLERLTQK